MGFLANSANGEKMNTVLTKGCGLVVDTVQGEVVFGNITTNVYNDVVICCSDDNLDQDDFVGEVSGALSLVGYRTIDDLEDDGKDPQDVVDLHGHDYKVYLEYDYDFDIDEAEETFFLVRQDKMQAMADMAIDCVSDQEERSEGIKRKAEDGGAQIVIEVPRRRRDELDL